MFAGLSRWKAVIPESVGRIIHQQQHTIRQQNLDIVKAQGLFVLDNMSRCIANNLQYIQSKKLLLDRIQMLFLFICSSHQNSKAALEVPGV